MDCKLENSFNPFDSPTTQLRGAAYIFLDGRMLAVLQKLQHA
jgi:hypothetical protein